MNPFLQEIYAQPQAVRDTAAYLQSDAANAVLQSIVNTWSSGTYKRIVATGMGSSYFIAEAFATLCAGEGLPAFALNAGELLHYQKAVLKETLLVAISQSGESYETLALVKEADIRPEAVIALTNNPGGSLSGYACHVLTTKAGEEKMTSTKTFITSWQVAWTLARALCGKSTEGPWEAIATGIEGLLKGSVQEAAILVGEAPFITFTARGTDFASARQSALMCMEALHLPSAALTGGDFRHGPLEMVGPGKTLVVLTATASPTFAQSQRLVKDALAFGGNVLLVSDQDTAPQERLCHLRIPATEPSLALILQVIPLQLLVCALGEARGMVPGDFYHGNKVTSTE